MCAQPPFDNYIRRHEMRRASVTVRAPQLILPVKELDGAKEQKRDRDENVRWRFIKLSKVIKMTQNVALGSNFALIYVIQTFRNRCYHVSHQPIFT